MSYDQCNPYVGEERFACELDKVIPFSCIKRACTCLVWSRSEKPAMDAGTGKCGCFVCPASRGKSIDRGPSHLSPSQINCSCIMHANDTTWVVRSIE